MKTTPDIQPSRWLVLGLTLTLVSCGGGNAPPTIKALATSMDEDTALQGQLEATDPDHDPLTFSIEATPMHGAATLDSPTGSFAYTPSQDYFGSDSFIVSVQAKGGRATATISIDIRNVQDAPRLQAIADLSNSAYTLDSDIPLDVVDVDGDPLTVEVQVSDPAIAAAHAQAAPPSLRVTPLSRGSTTVMVAASDGHTTANTQFQFTVGDVTKAVAVRSQSSALLASAETGTPAVQGEVVSLSNTSTRTASFSLTYNGRAAFTSLSEVVNHVRTLSDAYAGEPFARKLWRYLRDNTYHDFPISPHRWWDDYWATLNSLGFGYCDDVAAVYVQIARHAGFEARLWGLYGHVVPEIYLDGKWQMYDPDQAIYYFDETRQVASVQQLAANPTLIHSPVDPIFSNPDAFAYSEFIAGIYDDAAGNNYIADAVFLPTTPGGSSVIDLPPGTRLLLPGHWTDSPVGHDDLGSSVILAYRQAAIELPAGWVGNLNLPWVLWDVQGSGRVALAGQDFEADSDPLRQFIRNPGKALTSVTVSANSSGLRLVFMVNATWYEYLEENDVRITGQDVWAINIGNALVDQVSLITPFPAELRRPVP